MEKLGKSFLKSALGVCFIPIILAEFVVDIYKPSEFIGFNPWKQIIKTKADRRFRL